MSKIEPMKGYESPKITGKAKASVVLGGMAAMLAIATPLIGTWEGKRNVPYHDIVGVLTVCYGETRNIENRRHTDAECDDMLSEGVMSFAEPVAQRNPSLREYPNQWAAATSLAYNIGSAGYAKSTVAKRFSAGRWISACDNFLSWKYAGGKVVQGLLNRRQAEREICLTNVPAKYARK